MGLRLADALRLTAGGRPTVPAPSRVAFVGAGGKTTAMFQLARQLGGPVIVSTTTHLGAWQIPLADNHIIAAGIEDLPLEPPAGVTLVTGARMPAQSADDWDRFGPVPDAVLLWLHDANAWNRLPLLVEADGAHRKPLKAPVAHEPVIPPYMGIVVVVAGLSGLGKPLSEETVHRPGQFGALSGLHIGDVVTPEALGVVLASAQGGCRGIPAGARRAALLNQADNDSIKAQARRMVAALLSEFDAVLVASLQSEVVHAVHEPVAGIVLAAGGSTRLGRPKVLLDWHGQPFVRAVAISALAAGLQPVVVVTGPNDDEVSGALNGLPVSVVHNTAWETGQASSIQAGLRSLPATAGAAVFLLADQPQIGADVIKAIADKHAEGLYPIVAPLIMMERRGNPVLFDQVTFPELLSLQGDIGGRAVFSRHHVEYVPWYDERLLIDVDTDEDYRRLLEEDTP